MSDAKVTDDLKNVLYNISEIRQELGKDQSDFTKQVARMDMLLKGLTTRIVELEGANKEVRKEAMAAIERAGNDLDRRVKSSIEEGVKRELAQPMEKFDRAVKESGKVVTSWKEVAWLSYIAGLVIVFSLSFLVNYLTVKVLLPTPVSPFTEEQFATYEHGKYMENVMSKLSPEEQAQLHAIAKGEKKHLSGAALVGTPKGEIKKSANANKHAKYRHKRAESAEQDNGENAYSGDKEQDAQVDSAE